MRRGRERTLTAFREVFGSARGVRCFFAPGRVNLIGDHTDYNGGHAFPCALDVGIYAAVRLRKDRMLRFCSANFRNLGVRTLSLDEIEPGGTRGWINYPLGVIWTFARHGFYLPSGFDMVVCGTIPNGAGLSSSAALEIVTGFMLAKMYGFRSLGMLDLAKIGQEAENDFCGIHCGITDQFASSMGRRRKAVFLDTATLEYEYIPFHPEGMRLLITDTNRKHSLARSEFNSRQEQCQEALRILQTRLDIRSLCELTPQQLSENSDLLPDVLFRRARHAVTENERVVRAVRSVKEGNIEMFGQLMDESHVSLRDDYETSCPEADLLTREAWKIPGVAGSRITGAGFGGCTVSILRADSVREYERNAGRIFQETFGHRASFYPVRIGGGPREIAVR